MTPADADNLRSDKPAAPFPEQDENGVDLSLIRANLRLTPIQRIRKGDKARLEALRILEHARFTRQKERP